MPMDLREIADAASKALTMVEDSDRRRILEQFLEHTGPIVEAAARDQLQQFVDDINTQLAPHARLRLIQDGTRLSPDIIPLLEETGRGWTLRLDNDTISKVLLRMPSTIKELATESAQRAGVSLNSWTVNILERALENLRLHQPGAKDPEGQSDGSESSAPGSGTDAPDTDAPEDSTTHPSNDVRGGRADENDWDDGRAREGSPNDDRSDALNPNNPAHQEAMDNRSNQLNPNNPAYDSSRGHGTR